MNTEFEMFFKGIFDDVYSKTRLGKCREFMQHGKTSVLHHSIMVAYTSCKLFDMLRIKYSEGELIRGALLHDYFLYDWHEKNEYHRLHGFTHPSRALRNAKEELSLTHTEEEIIKKHMFPLTIIPPTVREGVAVCITDKLCSVYETFKLYRVWEWRSHEFAVSICDERKD